MKLIFLILSTIFTIVTCYECGKSPSYQRYSEIFDEKSVNKILGGDDASEGQWPWLVKVSYYLIDFENGFIGTRLLPECTAAIISDKWILSAGHCADRGHYDHKLMIGVGSIDEEKLKYYDVDEIIINPKFTMLSLHDDIALLKLNETLEFNDRIQPLCLSKSVVLEENEVVAAAGWGYTFHFLQYQVEEGQLLPPQGGGPVGATTLKILQERHAIVRSEDKCSILAENTDTKLICVGGLNIGMLGGDSGGALMARRNGSWYHVGNAHTSRLKATNTRIDVFDEVHYTETMQFCDFIEHSTYGEVKCEE